jgi:hypothetical protein
VQDDDIALIWLQDQTKTRAAIDYLNANAKALFIDEVLGGDDLKLKSGAAWRVGQSPRRSVGPLSATIGEQLRPRVRALGFSF